MSCYRPVRAYKTDQGHVHMGRAGSGADALLSLPCGRCVGCRLDQARAWSIRIGHEAQLWESNLFVTLDYAPEHLPRNRSLDYGDFQGFMRRLRKRLSGVSEGPNGRRPIRFFVAGEYGSRLQRPHYHAILFNTRFPDQVMYKNGSWRSTMLEDIWEKGNAVIGTVTPRSAAYCAGYTLHKAGRYAPQYGKHKHYEDVLDASTGEIMTRRKEFHEMSVRPGLGSWWYDRFGADVFPHDFAVQEGKRYKVPRYYWERWRRTADSEVVEGVEQARFERAQEMPASESSEARLAVREEVSLARVRLFQDRNH